MDVIACVLVALAHTCFAGAVLLEKPIALAVLRLDLQELQTTFPLPELWQENKLIKYDDKLKFVVSGFETKGIKKLLLRVEGLLTLADLKKSGDGGSQLTNQREIHELYFCKDYFYFDNALSRPLLRPDDTYVVDLESPQTDKKAVIEYIPEDRMMEYLMSAMPVIRYESGLTGAKVVKTYIRLKNGVKVDISYDRHTDVVVFKAMFRVVVMTDSHDFIKKLVPVNTLSFYLYRRSTLRFFELGPIHSVRVTSSPQRESSNLPGSFKLKRKQVIRDMLESSPSYKLSLSNVLGVTVYDNSKVCTLKYIETNQRISLRLAGSFTTSDDIRFNGLCLATPGGRMDMKDADWFEGRKKSLEEPVLFPCVEGSTDVATIVLRDDDDFIDVVKTKPLALDTMNQSTKIEPYLEYISHDQFLQTLRVVSDVLKSKCASDNRYEYQSYKLFVDISLLYDCATGIVWFDVLELWLGYYGQASLVSETVSSVSFDSHNNVFHYDTGTITDFKIRQLYSIISRNFPMNAQYRIDCGMVNMGIDLRSVEWDFHNILRNLLNRPCGIGSKFGVINVDKSRFIVATRSEEIIRGEKRKIIKVNGKGLFNNCFQSACAEEKEIIFDGKEILMRNSPQSELTKVAANIFWPESTCESSMFDDVIVDFVFNQERYVKLLTFERDMKELAWLLRRKCSELTDAGKQAEKLIFHMSYFKSKEPVIGYYQCGLQYIYFWSDFKVIKYPNVVRGNPQRRSGEASLRVAQSTFSALQVQYFDNIKLHERSDEVRSEEDDLRRKYSDYILRDLIYDHRGKNLHSTSMSLSDVYALRLLPPTHVKETIQKGDRIELKLDSGCKVEVYPKVCSENDDSTK